MSDTNGEGPEPTEGMVERRPPTLGEQAGLGHVWQPGLPVAWSWGRIDTNEGPIHLLRIITMAGVIGFTLRPEDLRKFVAQALEQSSGLVLPE